MKNTANSLRTQEAENQELIALASKVAKEQLLNNQASSQIIHLYAKEGTEEMILKKKKLRAEIQVLEAKADQIKREVEDANVTSNALSAFKRYAGYEDEEPQL